MAEGHQVGRPRRWQAAGDRREGAAEEEEEVVVAEAEARSHRRKRAAAEEGWQRQDWRQAQVEVVEVEADLRKEAAAVARLLRHLAPPGRRRPLPQGSHRRRLLP